MQIGDATTGNEMMTYVAFGGLAVLTMALAMRDNLRGGSQTLLSPPFLLFAGWLCVTVAVVVRSEHVDPARLACPPACRGRRGATAAGEIAA